MRPLIVASTRPELIKLSPVLREMDSRGIDYVFVTTGQHYDELLFRTFLGELGLRKPDRDIEVGSGTHAHQTSRAMVELEKIFEAEKPAFVMAEGDTNSVLSSALTAAKLRIPFVHVEAGLRSFDKRMPEEINRIVADHCSQLLFAPTEGAGLNLVNEGIQPSLIRIVGNTIVDATLQNLGLAKKRSALKLPKEYLLLTLHRSENVDDPKILSGIVDALLKIDEDVVFPAHPRTVKMLKRFGLLEKLGDGIAIVEPMGYLDFLRALSSAKIVLTDSGGVQEEAIVLHTPCLTLRTNTERPESVEAGGNILAGIKGSEILERLLMILGDRALYRRMKRAKNPFGDGKAGKRIVATTMEEYEAGRLAVVSPDFTRGFWRRKFLRVGSELAGKRIGDLDFTVVKVVDGERERFPHRNFRLKKGQLLQVID